LPGKRFGLVPATSATIWADAPSPLKRLTAFLDPRILDGIRAQRRDIVKGLICSAIGAGLLTVTALLIKGTLEAVAIGDTVALTRLSLAVLGLFGVKYFCTRGQMVYLGRATTRLAADLRRRLFDKLQRLPISYFSTKRTGAIQSVLTNDVNVYQNAVGAVRDVIDGPIKVIGGFVTIFTIQWQLSLISLALIPGMAILLQRNARKMRKAQTDVQEDLSSVLAVTQEQIQGVRVIKAFGAEKAATDLYGSLIERAFRSQLRAIKVTASLKPAVELLGAFALAITVYVCGYLVQAGALNVAQLGAFVYALDVINQGFKNLGSLNQTFAQVRAATDRIHEEILDAPEAQSDAPGAKPLAVRQGRIEFENVGFVYPDGTRALESVSFVIEPGTSLALVGPSGAGKSTIADLLLRFYDPSEGRILVDGQDIRESSVASLRQLIGVVPQQTFLFAGTISENIRLGKPDATDEEVREAARAAHAADFVERMPERYETELAERGVRVSGGEMQRLAIARALVRRPTILLLDEATSNLDPVSEKLVQKALEEIMEGRTSLFIAHRLSTAARADRILVLSHGTVVESGSHAELMESGGAYAGMYRAFSSGVLG